MPPDDPPEPLGEVFTRRWVVDWMLDLAGITDTTPLHELVIVEPSCGSGAFVLPLVERLLASCRRHGLAVEAAADSLWACDLHEPSVRHTRDAVAHLLIGEGIAAATAEALAAKWIHTADYLLADYRPAADLVIGNPPYVRHDDLPPALLAAYRGRWSTMRGRCDLYVPFFQASLDVLKPEGRLVFICADRWMRNQYGAGLRELVAAQYAMDVVVRMHAVDAFEDDVDAYPAITVIRRGEQHDNLLIDCQPTFHQADLPEVQAAACTVTPAAPVDTGAATVGRLEGWFGPAVWPEGTVQEIRAIAHWEAHLEPLEDVLRQTQVGIGVATGADQAYIVRGDPPDIEPERVMPLIMARHIADGTVQWDPTWLVNPWDRHGVIDIDAWPATREFLLARFDQVGRRTIAQRNPTRWYRTIDRVHPWLAGTRKILFADLKERMTPVVEDGCYYPHHNLYWITSTAWDIEVLAGLLLSDQAEAFIRAYCVKMRGGTLRMQAQYLRLIHLPRPAEVIGAVAEQFRHAYHTRDREEATATAARFYG